MVGTFKVVYLVGTEKTFGDNTYYDCNVMQGTDVRRLGCDKKAYDKLKGHEMSEVNLAVEIGEFNDKNKGVVKTYRVVDVVLPVK